MLNKINIYKLSYKGKTKCGKIYLNKKSILHNQDALGERITVLKNYFYSITLIPEICCFSGWFRQAVLKHNLHQTWGRIIDSPGALIISTPLTVDMHGCRSFRFLADFYKAPQLREIKTSLNFWENFRQPSDISTSLKVDIPF